MREWGLARVGVCSCRCLLVPVFARVGVCSWVLPVWVLAEFLYITRAAARHRSIRNNLFTLSPRPCPLSLSVSLPALSPRPCPLSLSSVLVPCPCPLSLSVSLSSVLVRVLAAPIPLDCHAVPLDCRAVPLDHRAHPLDRHAVPLDHRTALLDRHAVPLDRRAHPTTTRHHLGPCPDPPVTLCCVANLST